MFTSVGKIAAERNQRVLLELVSKPGNDVCADCKARAPRWASHNLGIFICMNCASIHRKIGTHVTKVKSITLDEWTKDQVEVMKENGNVKSNALYNPNESRHPPPANMVDSERDSELEKFIRSKYEFRRFIDRKSGTAARHLSAEPLRGPSFARSRSTPPTDPTKFRKLEPRPPSPGPPPPPKTPENMPPGLRYSAVIPSSSSSLLPPPARSASQPLPPLTSSEKLSAVAPLRQSTTQPPPVSAPAVGQVWQDLISLHEPSQSSSLPLQYGPLSAMTTASTSLVPHAQPMAPSASIAPNPFLNLSSSSFAHVTTPTLVASPMTTTVPGLAHPFVSAPLSSPALHPGLNPFSQAFASASGGPATPSFSTGGLSATNPFASSSSIGASMPMSMSTPATPSLPPVMALPTGAPLFQTRTELSLPSTPFGGGAPAVSVHHPHPFVIPAGQVPTGGVVSTNPFSAAMQTEQARLLTGTTLPPQQPQQQQPFGSTHGFGGWAGQGVQGTF